MLNQDYKGRVTEKENKNITIGLYTIGAHLNESSNQQPDQQSDKRFFSFNFVIGSDFANTNPSTVQPKTHLHFRFE